MRTLEIIKDFDNTYYSNLKGISEYVSLKILKKELKDKYNLNVDLKEFEKSKVGRKTYFIKQM